MILPLKKEKKYIKRKPLDSGTSGQAILRKAHDCTMMRRSDRSKRAGVLNIMWNLKHIKRRNPRSCNSQGIRYLNKKTIFLL